MSSTEPNSYTFHITPEQRDALSREYDLQDLKQTLQPIRKCFDKYGFVPRQKFVGRVATTTYLQSIRIVNE